MADESQNKKNKISRVITGIIISLIALGSIFLGGLPILAFLLVVICLGSMEYVKILHTKGFHPSLSLILLTNFVFALLIFFRRFDLMPSILSLAIMASFLIVLFMGRQPYIANVATTVLGYLYAGWLPCHLMLIRQFGSDRINAFQVGVNEGLWLVLLVFLVVVATDIGGYYFGTKFGKTKLAPVVSPKKTVEGAIGATCFAVIVASFGVFYTNLSFLQCIIAGFLITVFAQLGDLSESLVKRDAGVKDSSNILPGHGGIMYRADGYLFAVPVAYYYFVNFTHGNNILLEFFKYIQGIINVYF